MMQIYLLAEDLLYQILIELNDVQLKVSLS